MLWSSKFLMPVVAVACAALGWLAGSGRLALDRRADAGQPPAAAAKADSCGDCCEGVGRKQFFTSTAAQEKGGSGKKPNILVIWGDDIGVHNISAYNHGIM